MDNIILQCQNLKFNYKDNGFKLDIPYLEIEKEKILTLVGQNGAGKTTLLKLLAMVEFPTEGRINTRLLRREITMIFQEQHLLNTSVEKNIGVGLFLRNLPKKEIAQKVNHYLEIFKIKDFKKKHAFNLSRGQAQRVTLARALIVEPKLLLLDEPFSNIDFKDKDNLIKMLKEIITTKKTTCVFVTQNLDEVNLLSDRKIMINDGKIYD